MPPLSDEETHRLYHALGELQAQMVEMGRQRDQQLYVITQLMGEIQELRLDVAEYRQDFRNHMEDEDEIADFIREYRATKNKALGVLALATLLAGFLGIAISSWIKQWAERFFTALGAG